MISMKRFRLLGLTLLAAFALTAALAASASAALPELLPVKAGGSTFSGVNTAANPTLETLKKETIVCKKGAKADGVQENDTTGTYHIHFEECESAGFKCSTAGDATGIILNLGKYHYVDDHLSENVNELGVAILFLPEEATIECTALVKIKVKGSVLCLILEPLSSKVTHEFHCTQTSGMQSETTWWNDAGTAQTAVLLSSKNGAAFEEAGEQALGSVTFGEAVAFMNE
jgi:hypothetical protein